MLQTHRPAADDEHVRAVRVMAGNLACDAGFGDWNFRWGQCGSVVASMSRDPLSPGGRGFVELCQKLVKKLTIHEMRQVMLRLMIAIRKGKQTAEEHLLVPKAPATTQPADAEPVSCAAS